MTECANCAYHKNRAARWRAKAYKQAGHDVIELPWVGLTDEDIQQVRENCGITHHAIKTIEAKLREKNA